MQIVRYEGAADKFRVVYMDDDGKQQFLDARPFPGVGSEQDWAERAMRKQFGPDWKTEEPTPEEIGRRQARDTRTDLTSERRLPGYGETENTDPNQDGRG